MNEGNNIAEMTPTKIGKFLERDVMGVVGGLCRMNASNCCGYVFNPNGNYREISRGMYMWRSELYNDNVASEWTYYYDFESEQFFKFVEQE